MTKKSKKIKSPLIIEDKSSSNISKQSNKVQYEFGGPIGTFFVVVGLPFVIYLLFFLCNKDVCVSFNTFLVDKSKILNGLPTSLSQLFSIDATVIYLGWLLFHVLLERILPGEVVEGVELQNGKILLYTISGHLQFWITLLLINNFFPIITTENRK
jgi:hypothetical protein